MQNSEKRLLRDGSSGVLRRQRMIRMKRTTVRLTGVISRTANLMNSG